MNIRSRVPFASAERSPPDIPEEYRSIKGIGQLTPDEVKSLEEQLAALAPRVRFSLRSLPGRAFGVTEAEGSQESERGCRATICIGQELYDAVKNEHRPTERALLDFAMAYTLLHELAHAANLHVMGKRDCEDFFEDTLIAEAGFDYISRIFGMQPTIFLEKLDAPTWDCWQTLTFLNPASYFLGDFCRNVSKLPTAKIQHPLDPSFAERLLDDAWWEVEADRSLGLIPEFLLQRENAHMFRNMPSSLQIWLQGDRGSSAVQHGVGTADADLTLRDIAPPDAEPLEVDDYHPNLREKQMGDRSAHPPPTSTTDE